MNNSMATCGLYNSDIKKSSERTTEICCVLLQKPHQKNLAAGAEHRLAWLAL